MRADFEWQDLTSSGTATEWWIWRLLVRRERTDWQGRTRWKLVWVDSFFPNGLPRAYSPLWAVIRYPKWANRRRRH